jgi:choline dehydrogenase
MGLKNDTEAVVDSRARVYGVSGLRVVDASSFPNSPPGHPMSTVCEYIPYYPARSLPVSVDLCH